MKRHLRLLILVTLALTTPLPTWSQVATSSLRGTITDASGASIPDASITLERSDVGFHTQTVSARDGSYQFSQVPPGSYVLAVKAANFGLSRSNVQLLVNQPATLNLSLNLESSNTTVEVQADAVAMLNTTDASIGNAVTNEIVQALPMEGRNVPDLLSLQPGVLYLGHNVSGDEDSRSGSVAGSRSDQGNVTLDGLDNNNQLKGYAFTGVLRSTLDSVEEFRVSTTNAGVDSGRASGAQVNIVTKSGTNALHGALYEYNRNTLTAVNNWFNKEAQLSAGLPNRPGKLIRNTYGASVGGPVKKDKIFFFLNFEGQRTAENAQVTQVVPTQSFRDGYISYPYAKGSSLATWTLSPNDFASLDPHCFSLGTCPWGPGANPNVLKVFKSMPLPNGSLAGDGYNTGSFTWSAPNPLTLNTYLAKIDYAISDRHRFFIRGNLQGDSRLDPPSYPDQIANNTFKDNTKGIGLGEVWTIKPTLVNNFRFGFIRQGYSNRGAGVGPFVQLASISNPVGETRSTLSKAPVNNFIDDLTWIKGKHNFQFGVNYRIIHTITDTDAYSYNSASSSGGEYYDSLANTGQDLDPSAYPGLGCPNVASSFNNSYSYAAMNLAGVVASVNENYVYKVNSDKTATLLSQGAFVNRNFKTNQFEYYVQDTFHIVPKLTLTVGFRHSLAQTPYEVNGQQVAEDISMNQWFKDRVAGAAMGISNQPTYNYVLAGKANNGKPMWPMQKFLIAPRVGIAYALNPKTAIRMGAGLNYDNFGLAIANTLATAGSAGLLGSNSTLAGWVSTQAAPRFTGIQSIPTIPSLAQPASTVTFPFLSQIGAEAGEFTVDDGVKTPHALQLDLSIQRELPSGFTLETAYVGRLGRRLLQNRDIAMPLDLVDPASGTDYFKAVDDLENQHYAGVPTSNVTKIAYWENLFPDAAGAGASGTGTPGNSATQNVYDHFATDPLNASYGIYSMDILCNPGCGGKHNRYFPNQYSNLSTQSSIGTSSYHALQLILRHPMHNGLQADASYTFSKSIDLGSDTERIGGTGNGASNNYYGAFSQILNAFNPRLNRAVSDFDVRHVVTVNGVYDLPVGRGRSFLASSNGVVNSVLGGWQLTGLGRWTSGLPFGSQIAAGWVTSWYYQSFLVKTGDVKMRKHIVPGKGPQVFDDPDALQANILKGSPLRYPVPGEAGTRNAFRGDGYFGIDSGLNKTWHIWDRTSLKFAWEVFNVTNSVRFDTNPNYSLQATFRAGNFGYYSQTLTVPRVQQFSLRASF